MVATTSCSAGRGTTTFAGAEVPTTSSEKTVTTRSRFQGNDYCVDNQGENVISCETRCISPEAVTLDDTMA